MNNIYHHIKKKVYFLQAYKWIAISLFVLLLICISLKCCNQNTVSSSSKNTDENQVDKTVIKQPNKPIQKIIKLPPQQQIRVIPIDSSRVEEIEEDPLGRYAINDLLNIYLEDNVIIQEYVVELQEKFTQDTIQPNYYAEAYKRIQIKVNDSRKNAIKKIIKEDTVNVKFVTNEWVYNSTKKKDNDPDFDNVENTWFYKNIGVFEFWKKTKGSPDIKIAVLDNGFDLKHIELKNKFVNEWNVFNYSKEVYATPKVQFHGTHVAGSIIAEADNNFGISGVAPDCNFIPIQISNETGIITTSSLLDGIFYALKNDANIINLSLGFSLGSKAQLLSPLEQSIIEHNEFLDEEKLWKEVFQIVADEGIILVQAAGNDGIIAGVDPMKRSDNTIIVGALDKNGNKTEFSNYGNKINVYAPGIDIYSTLPNDEMGYLDGTSMSAPIIAGCVALIMSNDRNLKAKEIVELFSKHNAQNIQFNINDLID